MHMEQPALVGSDPETPVPVPQQLVRIDVVVGHQGVRADGAAKRVGFEFAAGDLPESSTSDADDESSVGGPCQIGQPHSRDGESQRRPGLPPPETRFRASPQSAGTVLSQTPDKGAERPIPPVALDGAADCAQLAVALTVQRGGPHCSLSIFEEGCHKLSTNLRVLCQRGAIPAHEAGKRANPEGPIAAGEQAVGAVGKLLTCGWLPAKETNAIGAEQSVRSQPEIAIRRLRHRESGAARRGPLQDFPRSVSILVDVQGRIERKNSLAAPQ